MQTNLKEDMVHAVRNNQFESNIVHIHVELSLEAGYKKLYKCFLTVVLF